MAAEEVHSGARLLMQKAAEAELKELDGLLMAEGSETE